MRFLVIGLVVWSLVAPVARLQPRSKTQGEKRGPCSYEQCMDIAKKRGDSSSLANRYCTQSKARVC
jgi:hypothetical protein